MRALIFALALVPVAAAAELDYVTDPAMCALDPVDRSEMGMTFDGSGFWTIEYNCQITEAISEAELRDDETHVRMGYCAEPGAIYPTLFAFFNDPYESQQFQLFEGDRGEPTLYYNCER